jgi:hypothetical protein
MDSRFRSRARPHARWVIAPVLVLAGLAAIGAMIALDEPPFGLAWAPKWLLVATGAALTAAGAAWAKPWEARRTGKADEERRAVDRLRQHLGRQDQLPRLGDPAASALALRVHPAIPLPVDIRGKGTPQTRWSWWRRRPAWPAGPDPELPIFVDRDIAPKVREWMHGAAATGGFLLLVGNSSVGKTRLLYQAARECLSDFSVLAPDLGDGTLVNTVADTTFHLPKLIVWLDELQRFLHGPYLTPGSTAVTAASIRRLLDADTPVVIVGSLWPEYAAQLRSTYPDPITNQPQPLYPATVDILDHRRLREIALGTFSEDERRTTARLRDKDPRLAHALAARDRDRGYNITEFLAGAPELVRRYERATVDQLAVIHAAVDARRLGLQAPLTEALLAAVARGYLHTVHPDDTWFPPALAEVTSDQRPADRATALLVPVPSADRTTTLGYTVADYLLQRLTHQRRSARLPAATWQVLIDHPHNPDDLYRLTNNAVIRLLYPYAEALYRRADARDSPTAEQLVEGQAQLRSIDDAIAMMGPVRDVSDDSVAYRLANQEAREVFRAFAYGDNSAHDGLAGLLARQGRVDEAIEGLRTQAEAGSNPAANRLAKLLAEQGHVAELRARADSGDDFAAYRLAELLAEQGHVAELRARADSGDDFADRRLAELLAEQGHVEELQTRADAGSNPADRRLTKLRLAELLAWQSYVPELQPRAETLDRLAAADRLAEQGHVAELRARADSGDDFAAHRLAELLAEQGGIAELQARADARDDIAARRLAELLAEQGRVEEAIEVLRAGADAGDILAARRLAELLAKQGRVEELFKEVHAGTAGAARCLIDQLATLGRGDEAERLRRFGLNPDGSIADGPQ